MSLGAVTHHNLIPRKGTITVTHIHTNQTKFVNLFSYEKINAWLTITSNLEKEEIRQNKLLKYLTTKYKEGEMSEYKCTTGLGLNGEYTMRGQQSDG